MTCAFQSIVLEQGNTYTTADYTSVLDAIGCILNILHNTVLVLQIYPQVGGITIGGIRN